MLNIELLIVFCYCCSYWRSSWLDDFKVLVCLLQHLR